MCERITEGSQNGNIAGRRRPALPHMAIWAICEGEERGGNQLRAGRRWCPSSDGRRLRRGARKDERGRTESDESDESDECDESNETTADGLAGRSRERAARRNGESKVLSLWPSPLLRNVTYGQLISTLVPVLSACLLSVFDAPSLALPCRPRKIQMRGGLGENSMGSLPFPYEPRGGTAKQTNNSSGCIANDMRAGGEGGSDRGGGLARDRRRACARN